ncbi:MAG: hypothetical protein IMZ62_12860 [Chloroflexi bacterium]|nr:hypothetical protein [Chloroflexota bacterium]MBE3119094.1 hypothetical protein [Candidatus Atribacteria bacterium]
MNAQSIISRFYKLPGIVNITRGKRIDRPRCHAWWMFDTGKPCVTGEGQTVAAACAEVLRQVDTRSKRK